eukprot:gb/GFBE01060505.1/.p1 GENE.gb/GFBE01060505.1/~~gb/GFBE01060505.1/.p1  ORF type:complete len:162 (+),score=7.67 gb/GFBE01060505.1/:1-486(+)
MFLFFGGQFCSDWPCQEFLHCFPAGRPKPIQDFENGWHGSGTVGSETWARKLGLGWSKHCPLLQEHRDFLIPEQQGHMKSEMWHTPPRYYVDDPYKDFEKLAVLRCPYDRAISEFCCCWKGFCAPAGRDGERQARRLNATAQDLNAWLQQKLLACKARPPL